MYEILILIFIICITLWNIARTLVTNTKYITLDKCLDYLPPRFTAKHDWDLLLRLSYKIAYLYLVDYPPPPLMFSLSEGLHSIIIQLAVELVAFILKVYVQTFLNFIYLCEIMFPDLNPYIRFVFLCEIMFPDLNPYIRFVFLCEIMFPDLNPYIRFVFLCFFEMLLLLSSDIETQPGPNFNEGFFSFCKWNINTLSKNDFQRVSFLVQVEHQYS